MLKKMTKKNSYDLQSMMKKIYFFNTINKHLKCFKLKVLQFNYFLKL